MREVLHYKIHTIAPYINWLYFFHAWGFPARLASVSRIHGCEACRTAWLASWPESERQRATEAMQLYADARRMLDSLDVDYAVHVMFALFPAGSRGECIELQTESSVERIVCLRQQTGDFLCLADFVRPAEGDSLTDRVGIFAAAADEAIEHLYEDDSYRHMLCQTLADRLAEAATECAHETIRRNYWGYAPEEHLSVDDLHLEKFQGVRPALGYPSLPDQSINFDLDRILGFSTIGIHLTESGAMLPHASVSGLMIAHPQSRYFDVGKIGEDQLKHYASLRGRTPDELRPFLAGHLYDE